MSRRHKRSNRNDLASRSNHQKRLPSVGNYSFIKSQDLNLPSSSDNYISDLKKVKIRIQGKPNSEMWGPLSGSKHKILKFYNFQIIKTFNTYFPLAAYYSYRSGMHSNRDIVSIKDAERHAKLLSKIEKYKEEKIQKELQQIEEEKLKAIKLLKIKRRKEEKRKVYLEEQRKRYIFTFNLIALSLYVFN